MWKSLLLKNCSRKNIRANIKIKMNKSRDGLVFDWSQTEESSEDVEANKNDDSGSEDEEKSEAKA